MPNVPLLITPGDSLVARVDDIIVFAEGPADHLQTLSEQLARLLPVIDWIGLVRHLASSISAAKFDHPPIACIQLLANEAKVFVFGDLSIGVETSSSIETVTGVGMTTWRESSVSGQVLSLSGGLPENSDALIGVLERGIVRGGGFTLGGGTAPVARTSVPVATFDPEATQIPPDELEPVPDASETSEDSFQDPVVETVVVDRDELDRIRASLVSGETRADEVDHDNKPPPSPPPNAATFQPAFEAEEHENVLSSEEPEISVTATNADPADHPAAVAGHPSADHPAFASETSADGQRSDDSPDFDSNETTAITGAALSDAVRAARAVAPDPRRSSGAEDSEETPFHSGPTELRGVNCPNGHLASMQDSVCRTCSAAVDQRGAIVSGPRPLLGVLEFDDGVRIPLDRPAVIGRQPPEDYRINGEFAYVVPITDAEGLISRVHVEVHLIGWDIELIDKNSVNGTFTSTNTESTSRTRLRSEHPTQIDVGTIVYVGDRVFRLSTGTQA